MAKHLSPLSRESGQKRDAPHERERERASLGNHAQRSTGEDGVSGCATWCQEPRTFCGDNEEMDQEAIAGGDEGGPLRRRAFRLRGFGRGMLACLLVEAGLASVSGTFHSTLEGPDKFTLSATPLEWRMWSTMPNTGDDAQACPHPYIEGAREIEREREREIERERERESERESRRVPTPAPSNSPAGHANLLSDCAIRKVLVPCTRHPSLLLLYYSQT